jgi:hypothetical protein
VNAVVVVCGRRNLLKSRHGVRRLTSDQPALLGNSGRGIKRLDLDEL